jgi:hypothetical protein
MERPGHPIDRTSRAGSVPVAVFEMATVEYALGDVDEIDQLYPPAEYVDPEVGLRDRCDVIAHYTRSSLRADGFTDVTVGVRAVDGRYVMRIDAAGEQGRVDAFARHHTLLFGPGAGLKAIRGRDLMERFGVWNPMAGFRVNDSSHDGESKWCLFPPLGLNVIGQKAGILQHYPPWQVVQQASDEGMMTWARWHEVLGAAGIPDEDRRAYGMFIDVNPIAAPGSGESEYPNDYLPIMAASAFFDGGADRDYIVSMLDLCLNPPGHDHPRYTLPLLVGGSPLYDPQAPGWFRVRYKHHLPTDGHGIVQSNVLQSGVVRIRGDSARETPYIIGNHMIAAGVTGRCTDDPSTMPDIRLYEAQDLVAASFLHLLAEHPDLTVDEAKAAACRRWFGNADGSGAPHPADESDRRTICALAQMDLFFVATPKPHPRFTFEEAWDRCGGDTDADPCCRSIAPAPGD